MGTVYTSETLINSKKLHGVTYQEIKTLGLYSAAYLAVLNELQNWKLLIILSRIKAKRLNI
jgi:hypothetical protein